MIKAIWTNGKRRLTGSWTYVWSKDVFVIDLDSRDRITRERRRFTVYGDRPEWGNWRLI